MSFLSIFKTSRPSLLLLLTALVLPLLFSSVFIPFFISYEKTLLSFSLPEWSMIYIILTLAMAFALIHTTSVSLISGYFIGWISLPFLILSYIGASLIGYLIARIADKGKLMEKLLELKGAKGIAADLKKNEGMVIFFCRLSPVLPFAVINLLLPLLNVTLSKFLTAGLLGMLPRTLLFVFIGIQGRSLREALSGSSGNPVEQVLVLILLIISVLGLFYYLMKAFRKKVNFPE